MNEMPVGSGDGSFPGPTGPPEVSSPSPSPARPRRTRTPFFAKDRPWLNGLLFLATLASAFYTGFNWSATYVFAERLSGEPGFRLGPEVFRDPRVAGLSLLYAVVLMAILLAHELGHYLTCRRYGLSATLPFFIPAPTLIGTLGAFIKIRSPIPFKRRLFDVGVAGPLAGFVLALPALVVGLALSKTVLSFPREEAIVFGDPLLLKLLAPVLVKGWTAGADLILHPVAFAGWVGILVTSLNLIPLGQLDGGHAAYAVFGRRARDLSKVVLGLLLVFGLLFWFGWIVWFFIILLMGVKHPRVLDEDAPLGRDRTIVAVVLLLIFILSFIPAPVRGYNIADMLRLLWP